MAFVGRGEAKIQAEFSACGKWSIVACASPMWQSVSIALPETQSSQTHNRSRLNSAPVFCFHCNKLEKGCDVLKYRWNISSVAKRRLEYLFVI
jgi:hypothetical protein